MTLKVFLWSNQNYMLGFMGDEKVIATIKKVEYIKNMMPPTKKKVVCNSQVYSDTTVIWGTNVQIFYNH